MNNRRWMRAKSSSTEAFGNTVSDATVQCPYCYEVQSETHWNIPNVEPGFLPNHWVDISDHLGTKLEALACYQSQIMAFPGPRSVEAVSTRCGAPSRSTRSTEPCTACTTSSLRGTT